MTFETQETVVPHWTGTARKKAPTTTMNPLFPQATVDEAIEEDLEAAKSEYLAEFRNDISSYVDADVVDSCVLRGVYELPYRFDQTFVAFVDPSGGHSDSFKREIAKGTTKVWERQGDIVLPTSAIPVDDARINSLMAMIVRGLFMHEFGFALHKNWDAKVTMFKADVEANIMNEAKRLLGPNPMFVMRNFGRGTFVYEGGNSSIMRNLSVWQFTLFGGLLLADETLALSRFSALTSRNDDVQGPMGDDELSI